MLMMIYILLLTWPAVCSEVLHSTEKRHPAVAVTPRLHHQVQRATKRIIG